MSVVPFLFRRSRPRPTRQDAFQDLLSTLSELYEEASRMKPEWHAAWSERATMTLPPKYEFGSSVAREAAQDMRFAIRLLQRNRWKSVVMPLFATYDDVAWQRFVRQADEMSSRLLYVGEKHIDLLLEDEQDWVQAAIEQFDDATRRRASVDEHDPIPRRIAEGVYEPVYVAIQLSDRLIERMRFEAGIED